MRICYGSKRNVRTLGLILSIVAFINLNQVFWKSESSLNKTRKVRRQHLFVYQERFRTDKSNENQSDLYSFKQNYAKCTPGKGLVFLKTHKTASTTVTNILLRYAEKHKLVVGLPPKRRWELGGYPAKFNNRIIDPQLPKYDILCHHFRYSHKDVQKVIRAGSRSITILRDPVENFESGFAFFRSLPYSEWFANVSRPDNLKEFLDNPDIYFNKSTPWHFIARNYMAFDLGFDIDDTSSSYAESVIRQTELWFDLVLITERLDESLILLQELLCIESMEEILYLKLKVRQNSARRNLGDSMKDKIRLWNFLDTKLYQHFNKTLNHKIEKYGNARMQKNVHQLKKKLKKIEKKCITSYNQFDLKPWVSRIKLKTENQEYCSKFSWGEVKFGDYIRVKQKSYINPISYDNDNRQLENLLNEAQKNVVGERGLKPEYSVIEI